MYEGYEGQFAVGFDVLGETIDSTMGADRKDDESF